MFKMDRLLFLRERRGSMPLSLTMLFLNFRCCQRHCLSTISKGAPDWQQTFGAVVAEPFQFRVTLALLSHNQEPRAGVSKIRVESVFSSFGISTRYRRHFERYSPSSNSITSVATSIPQCFTTCYSAYLLRTNCFTLQTSALIDLYPTAKLVPNNHIVQKLPPCFTILPFLPCY